VAAVAEAVTIRGIWSDMPDEMAAVLLADVRKENADMYRGALAASASALRMRPETLRQQPAPRQAATIRRVLTQVGRDDTGAHILIEWLTKRQRPMLIQFLDDLGIQHEEGEIKEGQSVGEQPEVERLRAAALHLCETYPPEAVRVYLSTFFLTTGDEWTALPEVIAGLPRGMTPAGASSASAT
jgi:hypothetical protein